jgi:hypothetical protein
MKLTIPIVVTAPDGATHFLRHSDPHDFSFYKKRSIGVAGDHWFCWSSNEWKMVSHHMPNWIEEIPKEWITG